jgi:hypothetical protein
MRIVPFDNKIDLEDINGLYIIVKSVPFENSYVPATVIVSPDNDHLLTLDELNSLMDGLEIAQERISEIINYIINTKTFGNPFSEDK